MSKVWIDANKIFDRNTAELVEAERVADLTHGWGARAKWINDRLKDEENKKAKRAANAKMYDNLDAAIAKHEEERDQER